VSVVLCATIASARCVESGANHADAAVDALADALDGVASDVDAPDAPDGAQPDVVTLPDAALPDAALPDADAAGAPDVDATPDASPPDVGGPDADAEPPLDVAPDATPDAVDADAAEPALYNPAAVPVAEDLFPYAVQAADPATDGAILWTRYAGFGAVRLVVLTDGVGDTSGEIVMESEHVPADWGIVETTVSGLEPGTRYRYLFETIDGGPKRSAVGRFATAPPEWELAPVAFGATSCIKEQVAPLHTLARAAEDDLAFYLYLGDTVYADGARTLPEYRQFWLDSYTHWEQRALHASTASIYTWDDHEVTNNWDPESIDPAQLEAARQAYFEHAPTRRPEEHPHRIWRSIRWGGTLEVFVLDSRGERKPKTKDTPEAEYLSPQQLTWLIDGVTSSEAIFKFVLSSVPITNMPPIYVGDDDRWEGYEAQREALLARVEPTGKLSSVYEVVAGPAAQIPNPAWLVLANGLRKDQFLYIGGDNNTTRLVADPLTNPPTLTVEFIDGAGKVVGSTVLMVP
jgi:alkaline phosphatase D